MRNADVPMFDVMEIFTSFFDAIAVLMALVLMFSVLHRGRRARVRNKVIMGGMFAFAIVVSMSDPIVLPQNAGFLDMRVLLVGTAAGLLGPLAGAISLLTASIYTVIMVGVGALVGVLGVVIAFGMGLIWYNYVRKRDIAAWKKSLVLGGLLSLQVLTIFVKPIDMWTMMFLDYAPYIVATNFIGSLIINHLLSGELSFLSEAEASKIDANTDHLTGLLNRRGLKLVYPNVLRSVDETKGQALLYFDVDKFKVTNDSFGHAVGDDVLRHVVTCVASNLRQKDTFVRLGGDEFVVVLPEIDIDEARAIGERCRSAVANSGFGVACQVVPISISVGAVWAETPSRIDTLLEIADKALYSAKGKGRNTVVFIGPKHTRVPVAA